MILEGNARASGQELAVHLMNTRDNEHVTLHAVEGFIADDLFGAFAEAEAISQATQCQKYLFSLSINPPMDAVVSVEAFKDAIAAAEKTLGLVGQPSAIVFHEKNGRRHAHVVWSRIDTSRMKAINLPHFKRKLMAVSHQLFIEHGCDVPDGFKDHAKRDPNRFDQIEVAQAKRAKRDPGALKATFRECWEMSDSQAALAAALAEHGFVLARGDRRGVVAVDGTCKVYSLSRWCDVKTRELRRKVADIEALPDVAQAQGLARGFEPQPLPEQEVQDAARAAKLTGLVERQRNDRAKLLEQQKRAEIERLKQAPKGLRLAFLKVTGRYKSTVDRLAKENARADVAAQTARQNLINCHLAERRALERDIGISDAFRLKSRRDQTQRLEIPAEKTELSAERLREDPALILEELSKTRASFTRRETLRELSRWIKDHKELPKIADAALSHETAVKLPSDTGARYTTLEYQRTEQKLHAAAAVMAKVSGSGVAADHVRTAIKTQNRSMQRDYSSKLSSEQESAIHHVLDDKQLASIVGLAGAGKSTMLATAADAWRRQGVTVHGAALAGKAADGLQKSATIPSRTLASLELSWKNGNAPIKMGDVLLIDEAGMIGTRQMARVTVKMRDIGAKLVLVGDPEQLQPIEAGTPFRDIIDRNGATKLTEIHRQRHEWQRDASRQLANGNIARALKTYRKQGAIHEHAKQDDAIEDLAERYAVDALADNSGVSRIALAHRRQDVHALNQTIRKALRDGIDENDEVLMQTPTGKRAIGADDRIVFTRNDKDLGVKNGMLGTVQSASDGRLTVQLDGSGKRKLTFDPRAYNSFDYGYAVTIHKSQGVTVDQAYVLGSRSMDQHLAYVAMSRHRERLDVFYSFEDRPKWTRLEQRHQRADQTRNRSGPSLG
ncbi:MAG: AAA family ATPase [Sulfitobacter sp.]